MAVDGHSWLIILVKLKILNKKEKKKAKKQLCWCLNDWCLSYCVLRGGVLSREDNGLIYVILRLWKAWKKCREGWLGLRNSDILWATNGFVRETKTKAGKPEPFVFFSWNAWSWLVTHQHLRPSGFSLLLHPFWP